MNESFIDDRLNSDMVDIRHIMQRINTNPVFKVEFRRNSSNDIVMCMSSESTSMPNINTVVKSISQVEQRFLEYIAETANWV